MDSAHTSLRLKSLSYIHTRPTSKKTQKNKQKKNNKPKRTPSGLSANGKWNINPGNVAGRTAEKKNTYHFIIDFMEMNFTDFLYDVFVLEGYEAKACGETETKQKKAE